MSKQDNAIKYVERAIKNGELARPNRCEICGNEIISRNGVHPIVAHHWNGYDHPLDIWWVCRSCNGFLDVHDGSLNLEQARTYVKTLQRRKLFKGC